MKNVIENCEEAISDWYMYIILAYLAGKLKQNHRAQYLANIVYKM